MDNDSLLFQTLQTSKELHNNSKQCWYTGVSFIFDQLNINDSMSIYDIKYELVKTINALLGETDERCSY